MNSDDVLSGQLVLYDDYLWRISGPKDKGDSLLFVLSNPLKQEQSTMLIGDDIEDVESVETLDDTYPTLNDDTTGDRGFGPAPNTSEECPMCGCNRARYTGDLHSESFDPIAATCIGCGYKHPDVDIDGDDV